jgi:hypothetical protein
MAQPKGRVPIAPPPASVAKPTAKAAPKAPVQQPRSIPTPPVAASAPVAEQVSDERAAEAMTADSASVSAAQTGIAHTPKREITRTTENVPEHLRQYLGNREGTEDVERGDLILPRLGLCQALTPQKKRQNPQFIEGLEDGLYFNSATSDIYGTWVDVIPLFFFKNRIKFNDINKGGGIDCQSLDAKTGGHYSPSDCMRCQFSQFVEGEAPECSFFHNFMSLVIDSDLMSFDSPEPIIVSMKSSSLKVSKQWNSLIRMTNLPAYARVYRLEVAHVAGNGNEWEQYKVIPGSFTDEKFFAAAKTFFNAYRESKIQVDTSGLDAEKGDTSFNSKDF